MNRQGAVWLRMVTIGFVLVMVTNSTIGQDSTSSAIDHPSDDLIICQRS